MNKAMQRKDRLATDEETLEMLKSGIYGTLSLCENNLMPYGVPLSYAYANNAIYFHCAKTGHKIDIINQNNNVCFSVVAKADTDSAAFTVNYKSVIVFGKAHAVTENEERTFAFIELIKKYCSSNIENGIEHIKKYGNEALIYKIVPEEISGKLRRII